jgi:hypothetical protein
MSGDVPFSRFSAPVFDDLISQTELGLLQIPVSLAGREARRSRVRVGPRLATT